MVLKNLKRFGVLSLILSFILFFSQSSTQSLWAAVGAPAQVLNYALSSEPPQLNAMKATDQQSFFVLGHVMEGLTRYGKNGEIVAGVAESWKISDQGATFQLRKNAKWADGKPVTAKDFIFSWQTAVDPKTASEYAFILYPVKNAEKINKGKLPPSELGVTAVGDHTLKVIFEKPCGYFLGLTAFATYYPVREDFFATKKDRYAANAEDLLSNGAYTLTKWVHGASLQMDKNPHYWNKAAVQIDRIDIPYITPDNNARFNFFKDRKVDVIDLGKDDLPKAQNEGFKMKSFSDGSVFFMEFNFRPGRITANKNLRKAIQSIFNPEEYVAKVISIPGTKPGKTLIPTWVRGVKDLFRKEYPALPHKTDFVQAKRYLTEALKELGLSKPPSLIWLTGDTPGAAREAEYFQNLFKVALGVDLKIDKQIFKQRLAKMTSGDFDIVSAGWGPDFADPMTFSELMTSWNENNRGKYKNDEYDRLVRAAQATSNPKVRMDSMAAAEKIVLEELPIVPTYERTIVFLHQAWVDGITRHVIGPDPDFTFAKVVK